MDTVNESGGSDGSLTQSQFEWVQEQLAASGDKLVIASSHHTSWTMDNNTPGAEPRVLGPAVVEAFLAHDNVVAWINGHTHDNRIRAHRSPDRWLLGDQHRLPHRLAAAGAPDRGARQRGRQPVDLRHDGRPPRQASLRHLTSRSCSWPRCRGCCRPTTGSSTTESRGRRNTRNVELLVPTPAFLALSPPGPGVGSLGGGQLAAGAVDLAAAGVADRRRHALGLEATHELPLVGGVGGGPLRARRGVERDQVRVHPAPVTVGVEDVAEQVGPPGLVVDPAHHGVLDRDPTFGRRARSSRPLRRSRRPRSGC